MKPEDEWIARLDWDAFRDDMRELGRKLKESQGPEDVAHLRFVR